jgi:hypothetical protein
MSPIGRTRCNPRLFFLKGRFLRRAILADWIGSEGTDFVLDAIAERGGPEWTPWLEQMAFNNKITKIAALAATLGCAAGIPVWGQPHLDDLFRTKPWALAQSTYHRVLGYRHPAVKTFMPGGSTEPVYAPYTEHYPPDTQAARLVADQPPARSMARQAGSQLLRDDRATPPRG